MGEFNLLPATPAQAFHFKCRRNGIFNVIVAENDVNIIFTLKFAFRSLRFSFNDKSALCPATTDQHRN